MNISWDAILGGFGLFIFGIKFMGDGLKSLAGDKLREYIDKYTTKPIMAVLIGTVITVIIQSSSATTAITIGLVRAGLMKLEQAAGIVMGANIGTTITAFIIGLKVEKFALFFVCAGALIICFGNKKKLHYLGQVILGFGLLFYGLRIMGDALKTLKDLPEFVTFAHAAGEQPILALLAGTVMTGIIQSSSAVIGVVQKIYEAGGMSLMASVAFVFGSNIGTTITGIFAAIGGSLAAKRTAGVHTLFNVVGTIIGMMFLGVYVSIVVYLTGLLKLSPMMQIAFAHIIFNLVTTLLFFPFLKQMCAIVRKLIPGNEPEKLDVNIDELNDILPHQLPSSALNVSKEVILKMSHVVERNVKESQKYLMNHKAGSEDKENILQAEGIINGLDHKIVDYLLLISKEELNESDFQEYSLNLQVVKNLERIGDLTVNLSEFYEMVKEDKSNFTKEAVEELKAMYELFYHMLNSTMEIYTTKDYAKFEALLEDENYMDLLEYESRQRHFERMRDGKCSSMISGSVYCDILSNMERMADHCCNIAKAVFADKK
ncbi:MAG: Na/Pi cotransporter family protein [Anaerorhabdus sp.]|uniref:Na/Pi cotransporter family protein n=1 Tax=Anaerorhabdus sp. TaxID=1872524 RepID=UPI002FCC48E1